MDKVVKKKLKWGHRLNENLVKSIVDKLNDKYESNEKGGKGLVIHLIKSFLPINPMNRVYEFTEDDDKLCSLAKIRLCSVKEIIDAARKVGLNEKYIESYDLLCDNEEADTEYVKLIDEYNELATRSNVVYRNIKNKDYAFSSPKSSMVLSTEAIIALEKFTNSRIESGDKFITKLVNGDENTNNHQQKRLPAKGNNTNSDDNSRTSKFNKKYSNRRTDERKLPNTKVNHSSQSNKPTRNNNYNRNSEVNRKSSSSNSSMDYKLGQLMDKYNNH